MLPYKAEFWKIFLVILIGSGLLCFLFNSVFIGSGFYFLIIYFLITVIIFLFMARAFCFSLEDRAIFNQLWLSVLSNVDSKKN